MPQTAGQPQVSQPDLLAPSAADLGARYAECYRLAAETTAEESQALQAAELARRERERG